MAWIVNKSERLILVEGFMLVPTVPIDVPESVTGNERIKEMMEFGELEESDPPNTTAEEKPAAKKSAPPPKKPDQPKHKEVSHHNKPPEKHTPGTDDGD